MPPDAETLAALEERVRYELDCLGYPTREWVMPRSHDGQRVHDVLIVGGGQSGVAIAARLLREKVTNIRILDRNPVGSEGPWTTFARMRTLRTPKVVTGPDIGIPSLSIRAWWEARFGAEDWENLGRIPRDLWQDYLQWLRRVLGIKVTNDTEVLAIEPLEPALFAVTTRRGEQTERLFTRIVVLATGMEGTSRWTVPGTIAALPRTAYRHTAEPIDFASLAGKRVAVIGAGASAFDNAATALEHGAARVDLFARRKVLPKANPNRWIEFAGFMRHFGDLDDTRKYRFIKLIFERNQPPPQDTFERCAAFENFHLHLGSPIEGATFGDGMARLRTPHGGMAADFVILGTGFAIDFAARPELARFADRIACWSDRFTPGASEENAAIGGFPYLSPHFQFTERDPGTAPYLQNIFSYTFGAMPSLAGSAGISMMKFGLDRITHGITRNLFVGDADAHFAALERYDEPELDIADYEKRRRGDAPKVA